MMLVLRGLHLALPYRIKLKSCRWLGRQLYRFARKRRHIVDTNLALCFPELSQAARDELSRGNFEQWSIAILDTAIGWWGKPEGSLDNLTVIGAHYFEAALAEGKGVLLLGAHFSTVDLGSSLFRQHFGHDVPVHVVYRLQKNDYFNQCMIKGRLRNVTSVVSKEDMRQIVRLVRKQEVLWYAPDHDFGEANSVYAPFFGHTASTLTTTAKLSGFKGAPVVMMEHHRNENDDGYTLEFFPALENFPTGDDVEDATAVNAVLEQAIRRAPEQYMWMHRRFKTQPGLPKNSLYEKNRDASSFNQNVQS